MGARNRRRTAATKQRTRMVVALGALSLSLLSSCERNARRAQELPTVPTVRIYVASTLAGAMEPCGCRKDMLGGVDHAAALIEKGKAEAPNALVVAAGPLFFMEPSVSAENAEKDQQDRWKADAIASALSRWNLSAWAPGVNDFGRGAEVFTALATKVGASPLAANVQAEELPLRRAQVIERGGVRIGVTGVSLLELNGKIVAPASPAVGERTTAPLMVKETDAAAELRAAQHELVSQGAAVTIALIAASRGDAMRLIEAVPGFHIAVIGKPRDSGESNDAAIPPTLLGQTLVVQGPNHLQAMPVVDLFIRDASNGAQAAIEFADATGIQREQRRATLEARISEMSHRLREWQASPTVRQQDLAARQADLARMTQELQRLPEVKPPRDGSFFRYEVREVREGLGSEPAVLERMREYYKQVNEHNRIAFKDRKPEPAPAGEPSYVGGATCASCHQQASAFWRTTSHAKAYRTLEDDFKEFNLDCVGCHVTGYEVAGGSTVTFVEGLKDVQCESCHGPGSVHVQSRSPASIVRTPPESLCAKCHHAPHVADDWDVKQAWPHVLGPGHGFPAALNMPEVPTTDGVSAGSFSAPVAGTAPMETAAPMVTAAPPH